MSDRPRGRPPAVTQREIVAAALQLCDAAPIESVSMRDLATHLGVGAMTIYNYVPNKEGLVELVTDHQLRRVAIPGASSGAWDQRLFTLARATRTALGRHRGLRLGTSAESTRIAEGMRDILVDGGLRDAQVELAFRSLWALLVGQAEVEQMLRTQPRRDRRVAASAVDNDELFQFCFDAIVAAARVVKGPLPRARQPKERGRLVGRRNQLA